MTDFREVEAKFDATPDAVERLLVLTSFGDFLLDARDHTHQVDVYVDTRDERLKAAGSSLRVRRAGALAFLTFKGERRSISTHDSNVVSRLEDEVEIDGGNPDDTAVFTTSPEPSPLARARDIVGGEPLLPIVRMETERSVLTFLDSSGAGIEVAVDRCLATRLLDGREREFVEVEAELKSGNADALLRAMAAMRGAVKGLRPSTTTKLERALGD